MDQNSLNLNNWLINFDDSWQEESLEIAQNRKKPVESKGVTVYFADLENALCQLIRRYTIAVGCVAWLTSTEILNALSSLKKVSIVIQKEDFLRPDSPAFNKEKLKKMYESLPPGPSSLGISSEDWGELIRNLNFSSAWSSAPIRWMGEYNVNRNPAHPRMHHKFLVLGDFYRDRPGKFIPKAVWTGSFNFTQNASNSMENALLITIPEIVKAYFQEWAIVFALSEAIPGYAWNVRWQPSDFRFGT